MIRGKRRISGHRPGAPQSFDVGPGPRLKVWPRRSYCELPRFEPPRTARTWPAVILNAVNEVTLTSAPWSLKLTAHASPGLWVRVLDEK